MGGGLRILVSHHHTALVSVKVMEMDLCWSVESNPHKPVYFIQLDDTSQHCRTKEAPKRCSQTVGI